MARGVLVDLTKCIGCGSCTVACKMYNNLPFKDPKTGEAYPTHAPNVKTNGFTWTVVDHEKVNVDGMPAWRYVKHQCMHCEDPGCVSSCFSKALVVNKETGAVDYDPELCVGCRYCMLACPFDVPKYQWEKVMPSVSKCNFCSEKIAKGEQPSCVSACPSGCLEFGDRDKLLAKAKAIIAKNPHYVNHIYGMDEAGGTNWLYISDVPFEKLGFKTNVPTKPIPENVHGFTRFTPFIFAGGAVLWTGGYLYTKRREAVSKLENMKSAPKKDDDTNESDEA